MNAVDDYQIDIKTLDWCKRTFGLIEKNLGITIHVHDDNDSVTEGDIFLFNHFARFETVIPVYLLYRDYGQLTRSITSHHLFNVSDGLTKFLKNGGAVPNNMPGLLAFLAAEILRGRKVVIYPEGGMIKDRKVMDDAGEFQIYSDKTAAYRKHHRGAAVLALTLDIFKKRILDVFEAGNEARIQHWMRALGIDSPAELLAKAKKPTQIVPGTITFHPLRVSDNVLKKAASLFVKELPDIALDEMLVEGNIILKDTDMDIRFGKPLTTEVTWKWWEKALLRRYFEGVDSLEELFSLKSTSGSSFAERILARFIARETKEIRNSYMRGVYSGITVNFTHIAASILMHHFHAGQTVVAAADFHQQIYGVIKELQNNPDVYLHRHVAEPRHYQGLLAGQSDDLARFIRLGQQTGLFDKEGETYLLREKLADQVDYYVVRLKNPLQVAINEVQPVAAVKETVAAVLAADVESQTHAANLFDDELRLFAQEKNAFEQPAYAKENLQETEKTVPQPYLHLSKSGQRKGVLFVHGFGASPGELSDFAQHCHARTDYTVMGVRLAGHGTSPWALDRTSYHDWLASIKRGCDILSGYVDEIVIVGFSTGGTLALNLLADDLKNVSKAVVVCAPLAVRDQKIHFTPFVAGLNKLLPGKLALLRFTVRDVSVPENNYTLASTRAFTELLQVMKDTRRKLGLITTPVYVIQASGDDVVNPASGTEIFDKISSDIKRYDTIDTDQHGIIYHNIGDTWQLIEQYITEEERS